MRSWHVRRTEKRRRLREEKKNNIKSTAPKLSSSSERLTIEKKANESSKEQAVPLNATDKASLAEKAFKTCLSLTTTVARACQVEVRTEVFPWRVRSKPAKSAFSKSHAVMCTVEQDVNY